MKKLILSMFVALMLLSTKGSALKILECRGGIAVMHEYITLNGHTYSASWEAGGCCCSHWWTVVDKVKPKKNNNIIEANENIYSAVNKIALTSNDPTKCQTASPELYDAYLKGVIPTVWLDPKKVNPEVYDFLFGQNLGLALYDLALEFNYNINKYNVNVVTDRDREIIVKYRDVNGLVVKTENVILHQGRNIKELNTTGLTSGVFDLLFVSDANTITEKIIIAE